MSGNETGSVGGGGMRSAGDTAGAAAGGFAPGGGAAGGAGGGMWGSTGITRLFESAQGGQIAWLIPAALILVVAGIVVRGKAPRIDTQRASFIVWGLWLLVTGLTFSFMAGIFHAYYTVALAPAIAALIGSGSVLLWRHRETLWVRCVLALSLAATVAMAWVLLGRAPSFVPWLRWTILIVGIVAAVAMMIPKVTRGRVGVAVILAALFTGLAGPTAFAIDTINTPHTGSIVSAGPSVEGGMGGRGGFGGNGGFGGMPDGGRRGSAGAATVPGVGTVPGVSTAPTQMGQAPGVVDEGAGGALRGGAGGGLLQGSTPSVALVAKLEDNADQFTWVAAAIGSNSASGYQLATQSPVMAIGGFNGSDPSPTLEQFQQYVADGKIHFFIGGGGMGGGMNAEGTATAISTWVTENFTATTIDGVTLYDLTA